MNRKTFRFCTLFFFLIIIIPFLNSCQKTEDDDLTGNWVRLSDFDGLARCDAVGFSIGIKGYIGTGYDGDKRLSDFWEYDVSKNSWTQKADFPGIARNSAVGFGTDSKGYIGTGFDGKNKLNDFWEYDPPANSWTRKSDFQGSARYAAIGMSINNLGYIGTGFDGNYTKDFWEYNPETDAWTQKTSIGGSKRKDASCFQINGKGYIVTGIDNGTYQTDLWEYDPSTDIWTKKRPVSNTSDEDYDNEYSSIIGISKVGFALDGKGYLATGGQSSGTDVWEYDPSTDLWVERTAFEGSLRADAVGFSIGNLCYLTTGKSGSYYFDDLWSFEPGATYNEDDK
jgi:N-acetylneuraminic acid mutarotase